MLAHGSTPHDACVGMQRYRNLSGNSGVVAYQTGPDAIVVKFRGGDVYCYTCATAGRGHVEAMKQLAVEGRGLSGYIAEHRPGFERR